MSRSACLALMLLLLCLDLAQARGPLRRLFGRRGRVSRNVGGLALGGAGNTSLYGVRAIDPTTQAIAERKAAIMARRGWISHFGSYGNGWGEGVGSSTSREGAISNCCDFRGRIYGQAVVQGRRGMWYACTIYGN